LLPERLALMAGDRAVVAVRTTDVTGEPAGDLDLFYVIQVSEWKSVPGGGRVEGSSWQEITSEVERARLTTNGEGRGIISFTPGQGGVYSVEAWGRDVQGRRIASATELSVGDPDRWVSWPFFEHDRLTLVPDKTSYSPEETARVLVQSPYDRATGLVTVESSEVLSHQLVTLNCNSGLLEIPLSKEYAPNVYVSLILVPQDAGAGPYPGFKVGYAELKVPSTEHQLRIDLVPDQPSYRPGEMASFTIRTRDHLNHPVSAEVSLGVVDRAMASLGQGEGPDMINAFYGPRPLGVHCAQSLSVHAGRPRPADDYGGAGRAGEQEIPAAGSDLAYWNPAIVTDDRGIGRASFLVPTRPTTWRAYARGITEDYLVGAAEAEITVGQPLVLRASAPPFLYVGDSAFITALVHNTTDRSASVQVVPETSGGLSPPEGPQVMVVEAGERAAVEWYVRADKVGPATFAIMASVGDESGDLAQGAILVLPFGERVTAREAHVVEGQGIQTISVPEDAGSATLK
ncbi:MAG TPA: hypothetical protein ENO24_03465, partial [Chloroflexi bacterium]|nr:hypothetical protein [Chloroflexota bacterium]